MKECSWTTTTPGIDSARLVSTEARVRGEASHRRLRRRLAQVAVIGLVALGELVAFEKALPQTPPPSRQGSPEAPRAVTMQELLNPGPQARQLAREVGTWDVIMRLWPTAAAKPMVVGGLVAERAMVGL